MYREAHNLLRKQDSHRKDKDQARKRQATGVRDGIGEGFQLTTSLPE
jgi:hypothetical protein